MMTESQNKKREIANQKLNDQVKDFLEKNPAIKEALRVFDISYDQYRKALESRYSYYTATSTSASLAWDRDNVEADGALLKQRSKELEFEII